MALRPLLAVVAAFIWLPALRAEEILRIAVAANFRPTLEALVQEFLEESPEVAVTLSSGSTGKLYAQIKAGAPFDLFFAADAERPRKLVEEGFGLPASRFTYALGVLALWSPKSAEPRQRLIDAVSRHAPPRVAIANPQLAPYGQAALETLQSLDLADQLETRLIRGENVGQAFHFAHSGAAPFAFVALSQLLVSEQSPKFYWVVPADHHQPVEQQAIVLKDSESAKAFATFCRSEVAQQIIADTGYRLP